MRLVYLNLTMKQYAELEECANNSKPFVIELDRSLFVDDGKQTNKCNNKCSFKGKLKKGQIDKSNKNTLVITLTALQCKRAVEEISALRDPRD